MTNDIDRQIEELEEIGPEQPTDSFFIEVIPTTTQGEKESQESRSDVIEASTEMAILTAETKSPRSCGTVASVSLRLLMQMGIKCAADKEYDIVNLKSRWGAGGIPNV